MSKLVRLGSALACVALAACDSPWESASCPPGGTDLTYESFGKSFIQRHCQTCHASNAKDRRGAPEASALDEHDDVIAWIDRIYERSTGENPSMPPGPDDPPEAEREALEEWLACGAP